MAGRKKKSKPDNKGAKGPSALERRYQATRTMMASLNKARSSGVCAVCMVKPAVRWPSGQQRVTCGDNVCFLDWVSGGKQRRIKEV